MRKQTGFTILELMIVVAILGVIGSFAFAGLREWNRGARRTAAVSDFLATLHIARSEAVKRNTRIGICPSSNATDADAKCAGEKDWSIGWIVFVDADGDLDRGGDEELLTATGALADEWILYTDNGDVALDYRANGRVQTSTDQTTATFNLCLEGGSADDGRVISIGNSGRPQSGLVSIDGAKPNC